MDVLADSGTTIKDEYDAANIRVNFLENYNMRTGNYRRASGAFEDVVRNYPLHSIALYCLERCYAATGLVEKAAAARAALRHALANPEGRMLFEKHIGAAREFCP